MSEGYQQAAFSTFNNNDTSQYQSLPSTQYPVSDTIPRVLPSNPTQYLTSNAHTDIALDDTCPIITAYNGRRTKERNGDANAFNLLSPTRGDDQPMKQPLLLDGERWIKKYSSEFYNWNSVVDIAYRLLVEGYLDPPYQLYSLFISNKKVVTNHVELRNELDDSGLRRDSLLRDFIGSDIKPVNVSRPFFFAPQFFVNASWNKYGIYAMQFWLVLSFIMLALTAAPSVAGWIFVSFNLLNFSFLYVTHLILVISFYIKHKHYTMAHMQSGWRTIFLFILWAAVFYFCCFAFWNTERVYAVRPLFCTVPALVLYSISYLYFYPRVRFGRYAELVLRFRHTINAPLDHRVRLTLSDCEDAKHCLEELAAKYHD